MKVLMLSDVYFPRVNGVSTSIQTFRQGLAGHGIETGLVAPAYGERSDGAADPAGADGMPAITRVRARPVPFDPEDRLARKSDMVAAGVDFNPALIHIQTPFVAHYAGLELARRLRVPAIATYHTLFEEYLHHYVPLVSGRLTRPLARRFSRRQCNALAAVVVPSTAMAERLRTYGVEVPLHIIPTGIPLARFGHGNRAAFRQRYAIPAAARVALFVGRVAHEKNIGFLLQVAAACRDSDPDLIWVIAGEGPALQELKTKAADLGLASRVRFIGYLDRDAALPDCYAGADVFTFASRTETQGLVLLEAMASGLPVLALSAMGTADIVEPRLGAVVARDDVCAFARQLSALLADSRWRAELGRQAGEFAQRWSDLTTAGKLAEVYRLTRFACLRQRIRGKDLATA